MAVERCQQCATPVDVLSGPNLRCACGKTTQPREWPTAEEIARNRLRFTLTEPPLIAILEAMVKYKALRVKAGDLEVELSPEAFAPQWPAQSSSLGNTEEKTCRCGHSVEVEHNDAGQCLQGCEPDACAPASGAQ